ncbi:MAG TPA: oligopeptide transporter, OPT family [Myxococcota bacterium]|jgi:putative OPT family oligopeptide transporter|nr:oligopeptide transporter, OPT family [Myxococcota bacterium]HQE74501.1 oligopeptide transporter, OPT family [Myxococcota bacterium]HQI61122.1 oligopeptide transporter, OPT family [Myxococcota bacterium]
MNAPIKGSRLLPANAYRKLEPGESYSPIIGAGQNIPEITVWSVLMALVMVLIFSAACLYIALRAGSGIEAAIPIAVAAIFFGRMRAKKSTILENVMVQSIGQASGVVAAGAAFVIPALYLNAIQPTWWQIFLACFLGGSLGVVLIIPLRKYFVADRHGELPFPEATAINEILVSGESSGGSAGKILLTSFGLGAAYDFLAETVNAWNPGISTTSVLGPVGEWLGKIRVELKINAIAALFGLGYIIGLKYAAIIFAGSVVAYMIFVPLMGVIFGGPEPLVYAGVSYNIAEMNAGAIFSAFIKPIAIGAIATAGVIGLIRMRKIITSSVVLGFKGIGKKGGVSDVARTNLDMKPANVLLIQLLATLGMGILFFVVCVLAKDFTVGQSILYALIGMVISFLLCFLFTPVAAEAIAIVGTNPVSGMTLVTVIISSLVMMAVGLSGQTGIFVALVIGTAVCTALSVAGALISDFKVGYWIGATPRKQQVWKFVGLAVAALVVAFVIPIMDQAFHFLVEKNGAMVSNEDVLPAPQANMIAAVIKGLMTGGQQPYLLYGIGALIAVVVTLLKIPTLAFALGMYLPIGINAAVLAGGFTAWLVARSGSSKREKEARANQGTLIASGMIAGAAIIGIVSAVLRLDWTSFAIRFISIGKEFNLETVADGVTVLRDTPAAWYTGIWGQLLGLLMFVGLGVITFVLAKWGAKMQMKEEDS